MGKRWLTPAATALIVVILVACGGGPPASPAGSVLPSGSGGIPSGSGGATSPAATVDEGFCGTIADLQDSVATFQAIKIRVQARRQLSDAAADVKTAYGSVADAVPDTLTDKLAPLGAAVDELASTAEDYATSTRPTTVEARLKRASTNVAKAIDKFRTAAGCTN